MTKEPQKDYIPRILVVDDDPEWLAFHSQVLGCLYPVLSATNGNDALRIAMQALPDIIILDVMMPGGMDGFATFCELRKKEETRNIPVLMLTEINQSTGLNFSSDNMEQYLGDAPIAFLEKPINPEKLREEVKQVLEKKATVVI